MKPKPIEYWRIKVVYRDGRSKIVLSYMTKEEASREALDMTVDFWREGRPCVAVVERDHTIYPVKSCSECIHFYNEMCNCTDLLHAPCGIPS